MDHIQTVTVFFKHLSCNTLNRLSIAELHLSLSQE